MTILAVDDAYHALKILERAIRKAAPGCELGVFRDPQEALDYAAKTRVDIAFLDIEMRDVNGLLLAKKLKDIYARTNIVFVTAYREYANDAFGLHCSGYILKPVTVEAVKEELEYLRHPVFHEHKKGVVIRTFGTFDIWKDGEPVVFHRSKAKEILAFLVDRSGAGVTLRDVAGILWETGEYDRNRQRQMQNNIGTMIADLKEVGIEDIVIRRPNYLAVDTDKVDCDLYRYKQGDWSTVNTYTGQYLAQYSWGEFTAALLDNMHAKRYE